MKDLKFSELIITDYHDGVIQIEQDGCKIRFSVESIPILRTTLQTIRKQLKKKK